MEAINDFFVQPGLQQLQLVSYLVYLMLLFHLPYMGMVLGSSALSTAYRKFKPEMSDDFMDLAFGKPGAWIGFGILPAVSLAFLYKMQFFNTTIPIHFYLFRLTGLMVVGFILLALYRRTRHILLGAAGTLAVLLYCFHLVNVLTLLIFPEKWMFLKAPMPYPLWAITPLIHFGTFLFLSLVMTGAGILFFYYKWTERMLPETSPHHALMRYHGYGLVLGGSLLLPVTIFWDLYTLPAYSLSIPVFVLSGVIIVVLVLSAASAAGMIRDYKNPVPRHGAAAFLLALLLFGLVIGKNHLLKAESGLETFNVLTLSAQKVWDAEVGKREEIYAKNMVIDPALGEQVYTERCTACHTFDKKILGPPFNDVLPKYAGKMDELVAFLKNPKRIDPNYPSMPNPGLSPIQIKAVVKFLGQKMGFETPEEAEAGEAGEKKVKE